MVGIGSAGDEGVLEPDTGLGEVAGSQGSVELVPGKAAGTLEYRSAS